MLSSLTRTSRFRWLFGVAFALCGAAVVADDRAHVFVGAKILPIEGDDIPLGVLVIRGKKILALGSSESVKIPVNAVRHNVEGRTIMPGLICTHSHVGGPWAGDSAGPLQPGVRSLDSINVRDSGFRRALAGGLTTLNLMSGSGHLIGGRTIYVKLRPAEVVEDFVIRDDEGAVMGGLKMANGTNSMKGAPFPGTRGKSAALVRQKLIQAEEYRRKLLKSAGNPAARPARDLGLETLVEVLEGRRVVHHHTHRHDDIMTVLRLANEFKFRVVLHHVSEGWKVAKQIAAAGVPCSVILVDSPGGKLEAIDMIYQTGRILEEAGALVSFHTDDYITDSRLFLRSPALAVRAGMSREGALKSVTLAGAQMLDLADRVGSLKPGKDADFIILDGDPLSVYTKVLETWVEGRRRFDRSDPEDRLFAVGGYGGGRDGATGDYCCLGERK